MNRTTNITKKWRPPKQDHSRTKRRAAYTGIIFSQHALFLGALGVLGITTYLRALGATTTEQLPSSVLLLVSVSAFFLGPTTYSGWVGGTDCRG